MTAIFGTSGNDRLQGQGSDTIFGFEGNDKLRGVGRDQLFGQAGNDALRGAKGGIFFDGGIGDDLLVGRNGLYLGREGRDVIHLASGGSAVAFGGAGDDKLSGSRGAHTLDGGLGNDDISVLVYRSDYLLVGGQGNDSLNARLFANQFTTSGDVIMRGGAGDDELSVFSRSGDDAFLFGDQGNDYLVTRTFAELRGGQGHDTLKSVGSGFISAAGGDSFLHGNEGNDLLIAGRGFDTLTGGSGEDEFRFNARIRGEFKTITDYSTFDDTMSFSRQRLGGDLNLGTLEEKQLVIGSIAKNNEDRFIYDPLNGELFFDIDGIGTEQQVLIAMMSKNLKLTNQDIFLY